MDFSKITFKLSASALEHFPCDALPEIAFVGRSNVGKSSLLNLLADHRGLAKVSKTPGRTQLINFFAIDDKAYLVDLPGYGYADVPASIKRHWQKLMHDYLTEREYLRGLILLLDIRREPSPEDLQMLEWLGVRALPVLIVLTKIDKLGRNDVLNRSTKLAKTLDMNPRHFILSSALQKVGAKELRQAVAELVASL
ncbi:MAG: ribosome biogenesis GTP-binding protein YihA/YsxC [Bradymonadia bacterium]|jgi:GTP-binding protein